MPLFYSRDTQIMTCQYDHVANEYNKRYTICMLIPQPVWKTWQIFQNLTLHQMSKNINKFNFPSVYSGFNVKKKIPLKLNKQMENWIQWLFCSFCGTSGSKISAKFSLLVTQPIANKPLASDHMCLKSNSIIFTDDL